MYDKRLDAIIKAADLGSFNKAAQAMGYSVPALAKQITSFEEQTGITIFERSNKGVRLTPAGGAFIEDARGIIAQCQRAVASAIESQSQSQNLVRVGVSLYQSGQRMLELCQKFYLRGTGISIQFVPIGDTFDAYAQVIGSFEERVDVFGSTYLPEAEGGTCSMEVVGESALCMSVPITDPLVLREPLPVSALQGQRIYAPKRGNRYVDAARDEITRVAPDVEFVEFRYYDLDIFDRCARLGDLLLSKEIWRNCHPLLNTMYLQWDLTEPYCLYFAKSPKPAVRTFVAAAKEISQA